MDVSQGIMNAPARVRPNRPTRQLPSTPTVDQDVFDVPTPVEPEAPSSAVDNHADTELTPLRAHYLKKALLSLEFNQELTYLMSANLPPPHSMLSLLGPPFTPLPRDAPQPRDIPFLRFMFRQFVITFPFLASAPKDFFPNKLQPFIDSLLARNLASDFMLFSSEEQDAEQTGRARAFAKIEKHMSLLLGSAIKLDEKEEVVRLSQKDLDRLQRIADRQRTKAKDSDGFSVNVVCVRTVSEKGRVRRRVHEEFVIRTRHSGFEDIFVSRRYGDFRSLVNELRKHYPGEEIPLLPQKDRTVASGSRLMHAKSVPNLRNGSTDSLPSSPSSASSTTPLQRERNRLTLRSYLHSLLAIPEIASSPVLRSFLTAEPTSLSEEEEIDAQRREDLDNVREEGRGQFEKEVSDRVDKLRESVKGVKGDLMGKDGLTHVFSTIRSTPEAKDLPPDFRAVLEWGRISLASTIFHHFIASDSASQSLAGLKRIHGLVPYFMLKGILKISNPVMMIRGVMDLFMARPFGGQSLLQRIFTSSMTEEVKALEEEIEAVKDKVDDPMICEKIRNFIYAPKEIQDVYKADAVEEKANLLAIILRSPEMPALSRPQMHRILRATRAHAEYVKKCEEASDSDDDDGPDTEDGWLFEDLGVLIRLYARLRDREQMIELVFEGTTADLLKDIITIFYAPLAQVYKAASIADSLGDLQNFINDLIRTVEQGEELSQEDPSKTVELFIDLVGRHEQAFYNFVHKVQSKGEGLFDSLMKWIELFLTFVRDGLTEDGSKIALEYVLPHAGAERAEILKEVDAVALYHYKLKVAYEAKVRRRFNKQKGGAQEEESAQALIDNVVGELQFGSLIQGDVADVYAEEDEEFSSSESSDEDDEDGSQSSGDETSEASSQTKSPPHSPIPPPNPPPRASSSRPTSPDQPPPLPRKDLYLVTPLPDSPSPASASGRSGFRQSAQHALEKPLPVPPGGPGHRRTGSAASQRSAPRSVKRRLKRKAGQVAIDPPELKAIPELLPVFVELIRNFLFLRTVSDDLH